MEHKITDRQLVALTAAYLAASPYTRPVDLYGEAHEKAGQIIWIGGTNMGGAVRRMVEDLRERGFLSERSDDEFGDQFANRLTAKGYEALVERLDRLPSFKTRYGRDRHQLTIDRAEIEQRLTERREQEAKFEADRERSRELGVVAYQRKQEARARALHSEVNAALASVGINVELDEAAVRKLVKGISDAEHGDAYLRYLTDADLSAELDEAEKQTTRPGTFGDKMRVEKVAAIRAEFARRADRLTA